MTLKKFIGKLGRKEEFDPRSRLFHVGAVLAPRAYTKPRSYQWSCNTRLDQGNVGSCVGNGWAHELAARPKVIKGLTEDIALQIYHKAQTLDPFRGENYEGTTVLAGVKAVQSMWPKYIKEYRWGFNLEDMVATLGYHGPVVLGVPWYQGMFRPDATGLIKVTGSLAGGHCLLARGVDVKKQLILLHNSWGAGWGINGSCYIGYEDMKKLLRNGGEQCIPVIRGV